MPYNTDELRESVRHLGQWAELPFFSGQTPPFDRVCRELARKTDVRPAADSTFEALRRCSPQDVRVVLLGQEPYPKRDHATGLAFSVRKETCPLPPTLRNISEEMRCDLKYNLHHGDLTSWADQGILLLNSTLTNPDVSGWDRLIKDVFCRLRRREDAESIFCVFWGKNSWRLIPCGLDENQMLKTFHPNWRRDDPRSPFRFFGSKPFSKIDCFFKQRNLPPIEWQVPKEAE